MDSCHEAVVAKGLPDNWYLNYVSNSELRCFEVVRQPSPHKPMTVLRLLLVNTDLTWQIYVGGHLVPTQSEILNNLPLMMTPELVVNTIYAISTANICAGNYEERFVTLACLRKGRFSSRNGEQMAFLDESFFVEVGGIQYNSTIRHWKCHLLIKDLICVPCNQFRNNFRALACKLSRCITGVPSLYTNIRFLRTPQKTARLISLRKSIKMKNRQLKQLRSKLSTIVKTDGISVDAQLQRDLEKVADIHSVVEEDEFKRIFWEQQVIK